MFFASHLTIPIFLLDFQIQDVTDVDLEHLHRSENSICIPVHGLNPARNLFQLLSRLLNFLDSSIHLF